MCNKMSNVRLSNASPTLERGVDARQQDPLRAQVRRNLFGRPDPEEIQRNLDAVVQEEVEAFRERYNFDPETETPLSPRNFVWQADPEPPEFYLRPPHDRRRNERGGDPSGGGQQLDAEDTGARSARQPDRHGSKKRRHGLSGPCSDECQSKRLHSYEDDDGDDDDEDQSHGTGGQAVRAAEQQGAAGQEAQ